MGTELPHYGLVGSFEGAGSADTTACAMLSTRQPRDRGAEVQTLRTGLAVVKRAPYRHNRREILRVALLQAEPAAGAPMTHVSDRPDCRVQPQCSPAMRRPPPSLPRPALPHLYLPTAPSKPHPPAALSTPTHRPASHPLPSKVPASTCAPCPGYCTAHRLPRDGMAQDILIITCRAQYRPCCARPSALSWHVCGSGCTGWPRAGRGRCIS